VKEVKLCVRVPRQLFNHAKQYASVNNTTLTRLVAEYLRQLADRSDVLVDAPIIRRLSGILPKEAAVTEIHEYLGRKYGDQA
jgi:hypothetical protein